MYSDVFSGVDVYYTVTSGKLKEDIVLKNDEAQRSFEFEIAAEGLKAELMEDNSVVLSDAEGKEVFTIAAPFMYDAAYADSTQIKVSIEQDEEGIVYTITADDEWLDAPEREYPVIIDPVVTTAFVQAPIKETYVSKEYPNTVVGNAAPYIKIGNSTGTSVENEGYIRFNEMPSIIGNNLIINAVLVLNPHKRITNNNTYCNQHSFNVNPIISAHAVTSSWVIGSMAWSNKAPYSADILDYEELEAAASADNREYEWNITETVRKWYSGAMANNGIALKMHEPTPQSTSWRNAYFTSSDYSSTPSSYYPYLYINYRNTDGLEGYNSYHSMEINGSGTVHINDYNGDVVYESPAIGWFTGERQNTSAFYLVYSNNAANSTSDMGYSFGKGMRLNVSQRLRSSGIASYPYYLIDADGTKHYLYEDGTGTGVYKDEDGMDLTMTLMNVPGTPVNNEEYYLVTDKVGNRCEYDIWGYLRKETDTNGNETHYNYGPNSSLGDNYLANIKDPSGRRVYLTYDSNYRLTKVKNPDNWETTFTYDANGCLTQISDAAGTTKLEYGTVGGQYRLTKVYEKSSSTSGRHYIKLKYENTSPYRADGIGEGVEGVSGSEYDIYTDIEYGYNQTKFTDYAGRKETIQYDIYGNPVCVLDSDGNASVYDFKNTSYRHKVTRAAASQKYVDNQIADPMFLGSISDYDIVGMSGAVASIDTTEHFFSSQSIKIAVPANTLAFKYVKCQSRTTPVAGKTYTMSAYIKTKNIEQWIGLATAGAGIYMRVSDGDESREIYSEMYCGTTDESIDNGWRKVSATVTLGANEHFTIISVGIIFATGEVYIGGVQFEEGGAANKINLLENSSFEQNSGSESVPTGWSGNSNMGVGGDYSAWTAGTQYQCNGSWSARIVGNLRKDKYIKTELPVKGDEGDVFILSAQAYAQKALPIKDGRAQFKMEAVLTYDDNTTETFSADFNPAVKVWQYRALTVVSRKSYKKLELRLRFDKNCGEAFFDAVTVYKDNVRSFVYDDSGNMVSATEYANSSVYSFDKNILTKTTTEAGTGAETAYDDNKNPVFTGTAEGVSQSTTYGTGSLQGRPVSSTMEASEYSGAVIPDKSYYIRSKANGKFLAPGTGGYVYLSSYAGTAAQRWKITRQTDGYFKLSPQSDGAKMLDTYAANSYGEYPAYIYASNSNDTQHFNLVRNADGSYHITSKYAEGKALTISARTETPNLIILAPYTGAANQCFYLAETEYTSSSGTEPMKSATPEDGGVYSLRVKYSGQVMCNNSGGTADGTLLVQNYPRVIEYSRNRQYRLHKVLVNSNTYYAIESICAPGKYVGCNQSNQITVNTYPAGSEPLWEFVYNSSTGTYLIKQATGTNYIRLLSANYNQGTTFTISATTTETSQFTLERVSETLNGSVEYTTNGNYITHTIDSAGNTVTYDYDANSGRLNWYDDAEGYRTNYTYDSTTKRLIEVKVGTGTQPMVTYAHNNNGSLASITRNGFSYAFDYDGYGNRTTVSIGDRTLSTNTYEAHNGNLTQVEYGNGDTVHYAYDSLDRLSEKWYDNDATNKNTVTYDAVGNVASTYDAATHRTVQYTYDLAGRLLSKNVVDNTNSPVTRQRVVYSYDKYNRTANVQREFGSYSYTTGYSYGTNSRTAILESLKLNGDTKIAYGYDPLMRLNERTLHLDNTTYTTEYSYVPGEKENSTTMLLAGIKNGSDAEITYTYDARGNIKTVSEGGVLKQTYHYDKLNQLIRMDDTVTNCTYGYRYNAGGNLTGMDVYDQYIDPDDPDYTSYNLLTTRDYRYQDSGNWKDLLTYYFGSTITYDGIGNPLNYRNGMTMTWEKGRRLASVTNSGVTTAYTYNDDGIRLTKKVGNNPVVTYETDGGKVLCQRTRIGTNDIYVFFFYDESGNAYAMEYNGDMYYYLRNGQSDIIGIIDDTGAVVARYTYDPWGKPLSVTDGAGNTIAANATHVANVNPFRYRGYFYDTETGFYYLQSRYYDPVTGRFINADGQLNDDILGFNLFAYCSNNPVVRVDDGGQGWLSAIVGGFVGAIVGGVSQIVSNVANGKKWNDGLWGAVTGGAVYGGVLGATGSVTLAGYAGAAVESVTNEVVSYIPGLAKSNGRPAPKKLTVGNVINSFTTVVGDTAKNGTIAVVTGEIAKRIVPINKGWIKPQKIVSRLVGKYALKSHAQSLIQEGLMFAYDCLDYSLGSSGQRQRAIVGFTPDTVFYATR